MTEKIIAKYIEKTTKPNLEKYLNKALEDPQIYLRHDKVVNLKEKFEEEAELIENMITELESRNKEVNEFSEVF